MGGSCESLARPEGLEPPAYWFEASRSIRLSYGRVDSSYHHNRMPVETEVKIRFPEGAQAARQRIEGHGYQLVEPRTLEADQLFERGEAELRNSGRLLRLRRTGDRAMVTYKGPMSAGPYKSREEIEFDVSDAGALGRVLDRLEFTPSFRYEKYRTTFALPGEPGIVTIDETPIGVFLELEGPPEWIDHTATRLGFSRNDYVTASYASLYADYRRMREDAPENMTFDGGNPA